MASKSSTQRAFSSPTPQWKYDVFLSFYGQDTRKGFTDHLYAGLTEKGLIVFRDDEKLERGKYIFEELLKAIEESFCAVVVVSKNYAFSKWCLNELAKIVECREDRGLIVYPVFYHVDPSDVRNQRKSFAKAFARHGEGPEVDEEKMVTWRAALRDVGYSAGWHIDHNRYESKIVKEIIENILGGFPWKNGVFHGKHSLIGIESGVYACVNDKECCIFRVHTQLRSINDKAYDPQLLAIGPYHRGKDGLRQMEGHKLRYLQQLLQRRNEDSVERYIKAMRELEERAREFYAEPISLNKDEFVEMMLLDGLFIIELLRKEGMDESDQIFQKDWIHTGIERDLLLLENQLPLFVLTKLFDMTDVPNNLQKDIIGLAQHFFSSLPSLECSYETGDVSIQNNKHLLGLIHKLIRPSFAKMETIGNAVLDKKKWEAIQCATALQDAGVRFKKVEGVNLFEMKFNNGVMEIPLLKIEDQTESLFRNLIAYEQYSQNSHLEYVTDYMSFMDNLIYTSWDVKLLCRQGIIENWSGDDKVVVNMFSKSCAGLGVSKSSYAQILSNLNKHCRRRRNVWMAYLRRNNFNSPWTLISFFAAVYFLLLTIAQIVFSFLISYNVLKR